MERERQIFLYGLTDDSGKVEVEGCIRRGIPEDVAQAVFREMEGFAAYAFNKAHAAAYATLSYQTAWLKRYYPREYMAALLTSVLDSSTKVAEYLADCSRMGIRVLPPHVNESRRGFTVVGQDIRFGLLAVKNLGKGFLDRLEQEREKEGKFASYYQFCKRMYGSDLNRRALESLIQCGALDGLEEGYNRRQMLSSVGAVLESLEQERKKNVEGQIGFFDLSQETSSAGSSSFSIAPMEEFPASSLLEMEKKCGGDVPFRASYGGVCRFLPDWESTENRRSAQPGRGRRTVPGWEPDKTSGDAFPCEAEGNQKEYDNGFFAGGRHQWFPGGIGFSGHIDAVFRPADGRCGGSAVGAGQPHRRKGSQADL